MLTNIDDDKMPSVLQFTQDGMAVAGSLHTGVDESGSSTSVDVSLPSEPGYPVTVEITSSNTAEGKVWPALLVFDATNWETPQAVYVAGQDDNEIDGDQVFAIEMVMRSDDERVDGNTWSLDVKNADDDVLRLSTTACNTTEGGESCEVVVSLSGWQDQWTELSVDLSNVDVTEGELSSTSFVFRASDWETPQLLTIMGADDNVDDGDITYTMGVSARLSYNHMGMALAPCTADFDDLYSCLLSTCGREACEAAFGLISGTSYR